MTNQPIKCASCEKVLEDGMEIEYSQMYCVWLCSSDCAFQHAMEMAETTIVDLSQKLPDKVILKDGKFWDEYNQDFK